MRRVLTTLALLVAAPIVAAAAEAPQDTVPVPDAASAWRLRGTEAPLVRPVAGGDRLLKTLGAVPAALVEATGRPVFWLLRLEETQHPFRRLSRLFAWNLKPVDTRLEARFGYESGLGLTLIGLHAESEEWFGTDLDYALTAGYLNTRNHLLEVEFHGQEDDTWLSWLTRYERKDNRPFYGLGPDSPQTRTDYHRQFLLNELALHLRPATGWRLGLALYERHTDLDEPDEGLEDLSDDDRPTTAATFPDVYNRARTNRYEGVELTLTRDTRNAGDFSTRGHFVELVAGTNFASADDDADYRHYSAELQVFRDVWRGRGFALRLYAEGIDTDRFDRVPFTELPALGGRHSLRGFASERFRDRRAGLATLEYRYPATTWLQGRVFADWGMTAPAWRDMSFEGLEVCGGVAAAVRVGESGFTVQYARSEEGGHLYLGTCAVFGQDPRRRR